MNNKVWNLYKQTEEYKKLLETFNSATENIDEAAVKIFQLSVDLGDDKSIEDLLNAYFAISDNFVIQGYEFKEEVTRDEFEQFVDEFEVRNIQFDKDNNGTLLTGPRDVIVAKSDYRSKNASVDAMSVFFYLCHPYFKPVLLSTKFQFLQSSCENLGIELPEYPKNRDYKGALMWYYDLCRVFNRFQKEMEMSDEEFYACLYGLGPTLCDDKENKPFPKPVNVWLTGASKGDFDALEESMDNDSLWACNENTRRGDIVVLYALAPHSCIHSIWRADSEGTFNPFDYYQCRTRVSDGVKVTPISLKELKDDPEFGKLPMLNNNLQGINGKRLPSWAYSALLKMIKKNGDDMSRIPVLFESKDWNPGEIKNEKDVEEKILIPVLRDLGYQDSDWTRQLKMKAGRKEKAIPDFVFFPYGEEHAENAPMVIEAKKLMASEKERNDNYRQGRSYAKMLESEYLGLCDEERLIIFKRGKNGNFDYSNPTFEACWAAIVGDEEVHDQLQQLIGREVIKGKSV